MTVGQFVVKFVCVVSFAQKRGGARAQAVEREWSRHFAVSLSTHASIAGRTAARQPNTAHAECHTPISFLHFYLFIEIRPMS